MGSVSSYEVCPRCKTEDSLYCDFYYKSGEEYQFCCLCGYINNVYIKRNKHGDCIKRKGEYVWVHYTKEPYAVLHEHYATMGQYNTIKSKNMYNYLKRLPKFTEMPEELVDVVISRYDGKEIITETIYQKTPETEKVESC